MPFTLEVATNTAKIITSHITDTAKISQLESCFKANKIRLTDILNYQFPENNFKNIVHLAIEAGGVELFKFLYTTASAETNYSSLSQIDFINFKQPNEYNSTALDLASFYGNVPIVEFLLANGATLEYDNKGQSAFHIAAKEGYVAILALIWNHFKKNVNDLELLNLPRIDKRTALHLAAAKGHVDVISFLHKKGATHKFATGRLPIHEAAANNHVAVVVLLTQLYNLTENNPRLITQDQYAETVLETALRNGATLVAKQQLKSLKRLLRYVTPNEISLFCQGMAVNQRANNVNLVLAFLACTPSPIDLLLTKAPAHSNRTVLATVFALRKTGILKTIIEEYLCEKRNKEYQVQRLNFLRSIGHPSDNYDLPFNVLGYTIFTFDLELLNFLLKIGVRLDDTVSSRFRKEKRRIIKNNEFELENIFDALLAALQALHFAIYKQANNFFSLLAFIKKECGKTASGETKWRLEYEVEIANLRRESLKAFCRRIMTAEVYQCFYDGGKIDIKQIQDFCNFIEEFYGEDLPLKMALWQYLSSPEPLESTQPSSIKTKMSNILGQSFFAAFDKKPYIIELQCPLQNFSVAALTKLLTHSPSSIFQQNILGAFVDYLADFKPKTRSDVDQPFNAATPAHQYLHLLDILILLLSHDENLTNFWQPLEEKINLFILKIPKPLSALEEIASKLREIKRITSPLILKAETSVSQHGINPYSRSEFAPLPPTVRSTTQDNTGKRKSDPEETISLKSQKINRGSTPQQNLLATTKKQTLPEADSEEYHSQPLFD